jgi:hypothetical protein
VVHSVVRAQHRSSHTRVALLGLAALGLLASIGGSAANTPDPVEAATLTVGGQVALPAGATEADAIRSVAFGDVAQPGSACSQGLRFTPPPSIAVSGGASQVLDLAHLTQLTVDPEVSYGDLDGDGHDEAVVHVTCSYGANGTEDSVHVWSLDGDRLVHLAALDEAPAPADDALPSKVESVSVDGDQVAVTLASYAPDDPACCPTQQTVASYALDGDELVAAGTPVTRAAPAGSGTGAGVGAGAGTSTP